MPGPRRIARELAMRSVFLMLANRGVPGPRALGDVLCLALEEDSDAVTRMVGAGEAAMLLTLVDSFERLRGDIDRSLSAFLDRDRADVSAVENATLCTALAEFRSGLGTPPGVLISEYIEVTKRYGAEGGYRLVNGVLDSIVKDSVDNVGPDAGEEERPGKSGVGESAAFRKFFNFPQGDSVRVGPGDDAAIVGVKDVSGLAISTDTLTEGVHFLRGADPRLLGRKALAVGLSDLAAMGAAPMCATVALSHPRPSEKWLAGFAEGLAEMASEHGLDIVGGDMSAGPTIAVTATVCGRAGRRVLRRSGLRPGDHVWVTGDAGEALLGLLLIEGRARLDSATASRLAVGRHQDPSPRVAVGLAIAAYATAAIDVSDGLWKSLRLVAEASGTMVRVDAGELPLSAGLTEAQGVDPLATALGASDDYELLFGAPADKGEAIAELSRQAGVRITRIGTVAKGDGVVLLQDGKDITKRQATDGHEHWA